MKIPQQGIASVILGLFAIAARADLTPSTAPTTLPSNTTSAYRGVTSDNVYHPLPTTQPDGSVVDPPAVHVEPISDALRQDYGLNAFYKKTLSIDGIPIIASDRVSDYALLECAFTLDHMLKETPRDIKDALVDAKVRMGIIAVVEYTMDIPENQTRRNMGPIQAAFQDRRSRGLGGLPLATCAEENLLNLRGDPYTAENITIHEFSHTVASAVRRVNPDWYRKLRSTYEQAMSDGLFANTYSATNEQEYWAEGAQAWFDCAARRKDANVHSGIWNREQLRAYDPRLAELLAGVYGNGDWRYVKTTNRPVIVDGKTYTRTPADLAHLAGIDRAMYPVFNFNNSPRIAAAARANANPNGQ